MGRRKETRTVTRTTQVRIEFTAADLRKRLRLPPDSVLSVASVELGDEVALVAEHTTTKREGT